MKFKPLCLVLGMLASLGALPGAKAQPEPLAAARRQSLTVLRATELRADKLPSAPVLGQLALGAALRLISAEGGWALVETSTSAGKEEVKLSGWVRASAVNWQSGQSAASRLASGREAAGNTVLTLGVRGVPPRINRHALIMGVSRYADPAMQPLPGVRIDRESATQMARFMQIPVSNIFYLQDEQATARGIRQAFHELANRVGDGDRVFIHFSGHGTRYTDPASGGCVQAIAAYDGGLIASREVADLIKPIASRTDKLFVMQDACHAGAIAPTASAGPAPGFTNINDEGVLRPKFVIDAAECGQPADAKIRSAAAGAAVRSAPAQDVMHIRASRDNQICFDDELKGGLATQFMRDCLLRDARDLDNSGAISTDEIRQCAQAKINQRLANDASHETQNLVLSGTAAFAPAWFSQPNAAAVTVTPAPPR